MIDLALHRPLALPQIKLQIAPSKSCCYLLGLSLLRGGGGGAHRCSSSLPLTCLKALRGSSPSSCLPQELLALLAVVYLTPPLAKAGLKAARGFAGGLAGSHRGSRLGLGLTKTWGRRLCFARFKMCPLLPPAIGVRFG